MNSSATFHADLPNSTSTLSNIYISKSNVYLALVSLDPTKASRIDGIGLNILKQCVLALTKPTHHLFVLRLTQHVIPQKWKFHCITLIHKGRNKSMTTEQYHFYALYPRPSNA